MPEVKTDYCDQCLCLEGATVGNVTGNQGTTTTPLNPDTTTQSGFETTANAQCNVNTGDGYCDDDLNTATCNYDGGNAFYKAKLLCQLTLHLQQTYRGLLFGRYQD